MLRALRWAGLAERENREVADSAPQPVCLFLALVLREREAVAAPLSGPGRVGAAQLKALPEGSRSPDDFSFAAPEGHSGPSVPSSWCRQMSLEGRGGMREGLLQFKGEGYGFTLCSYWPQGTVDRTHLEQGTPGIRFRSTGSRFYWGYDAWTHLSVVLPLSMVEV